MLWRRGGEQWASPLTQKREVFLPRERRGPSKNQARRGGGKPTPTYDLGMYEENKKEVRVLSHNVKKEYI